MEMARDGAHIIDVGGESTRPYAEQISSKEEMNRVVPVIKALSKEIRQAVSIDTYKADVAEAALAAGATMINDISSLRFDSRMAGVCADAGVPIVLMHMKGTPRNMQDKPTYADLIPDVLAFLRDAVDRAVAAGIREDLIVVDPGIGFGKSFDDNLKIINGLSRFAELGKPILLGPSNKAFLGRILENDPHERETGTMAAIAAGVLKGAHMVRAHSVKKAVETVMVIDAIRRESVGIRTSG